MRTDWGVAVDVPRGTIAATRLLATPTASATWPNDQPARTAATMAASRALAASRSRVCAARQRLSAATAAANAFLSAGMVAGARSHAPRPAQLEEVTSQPGKVTVHRQ